MAEQSIILSPENQQQLDRDQKLAGFWEEFSFFGDTVPLLDGHPLLVYCLFFVVPYLISALTFGISWGVNSENWLPLMTVAFAETNIVFIGVSLALMAYFRWQLKVPSTFMWLFEKLQTRSPSASTQKSFLLYLQGYQKELSSTKKKHSLALLLSLLILLLASSLENLFAIVSDFHELSVLITFVIWSYIVGLLTWQLYITIKYLRSLNRKFAIKIQFHHPDKCGGLQPLGNFCFSMTWPVLILGFMASCLGILTLLEAYTGTVSDLYARLGLAGIAQYRSSFGEASIIFLFVVILPLLIVIFFAPVWNIHLEMLGERQRAEDRIAILHGQLEQQIHNNLDTDSRLEKAEEAETRLKIARFAYPIDQRYPVWPFRFDVLLKLFAPQLLLSVAGLILSIYEIL